MSNVNWDRVVSCVAGVDGLEVVERDDSGMLGAARNVPYSRQSPVRAPPQAQPVGYSLNTYRLRITTYIKCKDVNGSLLFGAPTQSYGPSFFALSDEEARPKMSNPIITLGNGCTQKSCWALERLEKQPGYASSWTTIATEPNCSATQP